MTQIEVTVKVDTSNKAQRDALNNLLDTLSGQEVATASPATEKKEEKATEGKAKAKAKTEVKGIAATTDVITEEKITLAVLRELTAAKTEHREKIKKKLAEFGVANVSSIPEDKFADYHKFITSL